MELNYLTGDHDFDWAETWMDPMLETQTGVREYELPDDFPLNFVPTETGDGYMCILKTSSTVEQKMDFLSLERFYSANLSAESNGTPSHYTIKTTKTGRRILALSPLPDSSTYTISGLYRPTNWALDDQDEVPPMPNAQVLVSAVLRRFKELAAEYEGKYQSAYGGLLLENARNKRVALSPNILKYNSMRINRRLRDAGIRL
jgi:hypothetical protein